MIEPIIMYTITCDGCGKDAFEHEEIRAWVNPNHAWATAEDMGFKEINSKDYCPDCYHYDNDGNETRN